MKPTCPPALRHFAAALLAVGLFSAPVLGQRSPNLAELLAREEGEPPAAAEHAERRGFSLEGVSLPQRYGMPDRWWLTASAGAAVDLRRDSESYSMHLAGSYFFVEDLSVDLQASLFFLDQEFNDVVAGSGALLFRQHWWLADGKTTFYLDAGAGLLGASDDIPEDGAEFGLTPQIGAGFTLPIGEDDARLMIGVKWHHISTGRLNGSDGNEGRDAAMLYLGLTFPF